MILGDSQIDIRLFRLHALTFEAPQFFRCPKFQWTTWSQQQFEFRNTHFPFEHPHTVGFVCIPAWQGFISWSPLEKNIALVFWFVWIKFHCHQLLFLFICCLHHLAMGLKPSLACPSLLVLISPVQKHAGDDLEFHLLQTTIAFGVPLSMESIKHPASSFFNFMVRQTWNTPTHGLWNLRFWSCDGPRTGGGDAASDDFFCIKLIALVVALVVRL